MADPDERLDVYDELGVHLGVKARGAVHRDGDWHRCVHLWVLSGDAVLLQRRGRHKASWPGALDATAAGHVAAGESVR
ncbi:MAG: NUDIX hydrolase, partial [Solirubrobacterales bacterium]|nr:NUDIX hydrolase [Solirubrobacterales bacterium]